MPRLLIAAGGGGDAVAAVMLHQALHGNADDSPVLVLTYSWDRLLVDPVPGPRRPEDFTGLTTLTPLNHAVTATSGLRPPFGSTLPRLAAELLPYTFVLIDPYEGVCGLVRQIREILGRYEPVGVDLLDVGGDILAHGDEAALRSPLADALVLAACAQLGFPVRLFVAGPGLDGEIPADVLRDRLGPRALTFGPHHADTVARVLRWHPSEATALLAASACGVRGVCEVRDAGSPVPLTDESPGVFEVDLAEAFRENAVAQALAETRTLQGAEEACRRACGFSEIDYERDKASGGRRAGMLAPSELLARYGEFEDGARTRGVTHTTYRRIAEALDVSPAQREPLRALLVERWPARQDGPLWRLEGGSSGGGR